MLKEKFKRGWNYDFYINEKWIFLNILKNERVRKVYNYFKGDYW